VYSNRFLFWSVVIGALSVFPVVYIPFLNTQFFRHYNITWEWALSVGFTLVFVAGIETWKLIKRTFHLLEDKPVQRGAWGQGSGSDDQGVKFRKTMSMSSFKTWASFSRKDTGDSRTSGVRSSNIGNQIQAQATQDVYRDPSTPVKCHHLFFANLSARYCTCIYVEEEEGDG
jgi:hypothetical protein